MARLPVVSGDDATRAFQKVGRLVRPGGAGGAPPPVLDLGEVCLQCGKVLCESSLQDCLEFHRTLNVSPFI